MRKYTRETLKNKMDLFTNETTYFTEELNGNRYIYIFESLGNGNYKITNIQNDEVDIYIDNIDNEYGELAMLLEIL